MLILTKKPQEIYIPYVFALMSVQDHRSVFLKEHFTRRCLLSRKTEMIDSKNQELDVIIYISYCSYDVGYLLQNRKRYKHLNAIYYVKISGFTFRNQIR
jgi:hypothetical protein